VNRTKSKNRRVLITGGAGLLAPFLAEAGRNFGSIALTCRREGDNLTDLAHGGEVIELVKSTRPDVVIHCAAMTDVDGCESDPVAADRGNRLTSENLAAALHSDCQLIYISTDQVYPDISGPHLEGTEDPINCYGASKLTGEQAALRHPGGTALRCNFFGPSQTPGRKSLSDFVVESLTARREITFFTDILFSPLHARTLAALVFEIIERRLPGTYNLASRDGVSKADFALGIAAHLGLQTETATIGTSANQPGRAVRPSDLRMDPGRLEAALGRRMPTLQQEIEKL
jgi:dTDP-4-dehydrorhamnose reductase